MPAGQRGRRERSRCDRVPDALRTLLDAILVSIDAPDVDRGRLAAAVGFSPDHLDRLVSAAAGESATALRRRLLLERAAWEIQRGATIASAARGAGYGSSAAFSRAFAAAPRAYAATRRGFRLNAPNGLHFHPPAGLALPPRLARPATSTAVLERLLAHHVAHSREMLKIVASLDPVARDRRLRSGQAITWFDGEEPTIALMAERLVATLETWNAAMRGTEPPQVGRDALLARFESAATIFLASCQRLERDARWDAAFVDAICRPPELIVYADVVAHVLD